MILLVTGSSTEPTLFHAGYRPILLVGILQRLYLTLSQNGQHSHPTMRGTHPTPCQKGTTLTFTNMIGTNTIICGKALHLHLTLTRQKRKTLTFSSMIGHNYYHL